MFVFIQKLLRRPQVSRYTTVRYAFPLVVIATIFASLASVVSEQGSYITIKTSQVTIEQDQIFYIDILATTHVPVNAVDLVIAYPEEDMVVDSIDTGLSVITLWTEDPYAKDGNIYLRGGTFRKGFVGEHTIARIKAHAVKSGVAKIFIRDTQLVAGDGKGTEVTAVESPLGNEIQIAITSSGELEKKEVSLAILSDVDNDGDVDLGDISSFMAAWFTRRQTFDFNNDGRMTFTDFSILLADSFFK
jgi:hypothetical protein